MQDVVLVGKNILLLQMSAIAGKSVPLPPWPGNLKVSGAHLVDFPAFHLFARAIRLFLTPLPSASHSVCFAGRCCATSHRSVLVPPTGHLATVH